MRAYLLIALMTMATMAVFRVASYMALGPQGSWVLIMLVSLAITYFFTKIIERA